MRFKVVYQCSGCENPICDGDHYFKTPYGYFCADCVEQGDAEFKEDYLDKMFGNPLEELDRLSIRGQEDGMR